MFRNFVSKETLTLNEYRILMDKTSHGEKYCNAFCQKILNLDDFYENKASCKECYNFMIKIKKMVDSGQLTYEQFRLNNDLVKRDKIIIDIYKTCITCEEELSLDKFEATRRECILCRKKKKKINHEEQFEKYKKSIEEVKTDITILTRLLKSMSSDLLKLVVKEYKITMSHEDRKKDIMIVKIIDYFSSLLSPFVCLGKCGATLTTEFSVCYKCKIKPKTSAEENMLEFEKKLDKLVEDLESMSREDSYPYNKKQIILIAKKLSIKFSQTQDKFVIADLIDKHLQNKKEQEQKSILENIGGEINLNGITILSRSEDGFINATALCKAGNKKFNDWYRLDSTKQLILELEKNLDLDNPLNVSGSTGFPVDPETTLNTCSKTIDIINTGSNNLRGSWIHPDLAVPLAQWISPSFSIQVSRWIRELALTGSVILGNEKTCKQLLQLQIDNKKLKDDNKKIEDKHRKLLQKKDYHKFKKGSVFYIISDMDGKSLKFKVGFDSKSCDLRLQQHRTGVSACKLEYLIYSNDADFIEKAVKKKFISKMLMQNHEWIFDVDVNYIIKCTKTILDASSIEYTEEKDLEEYNQQILLDYESTKK